jgi:hypothetical protein
MPTHLIDPGYVFCSTDHNAVKRDHRTVQDRLTQKYRVTPSRILALYEPVIDPISWLEMLVARVVATLKVGDCNDESETQCKENFCSCVDAALGVSVHYWRLLAVDSPGFRHTA